MNGIEFKAFITNLGKYNEGDLVGDWVSFPIEEAQFNEILTRLVEIDDEYEEWFVSDYDCDLKSFDWQELGEYPSYEKLQEFGLLVNEITDAKAVDNAYEITGNLEEAIEGLDNGNIIFYDGVSTDRDLGYYLIDNIDGGVENLPLSTIEEYFDYEGLGRDLSFDSYGEDDDINAGEYFCGDEDASDTEIGEAYVEEVGIEGVANPENYFDFEEYGRRFTMDNGGDFTPDGYVEIV